MSIKISLPLSENIRRRSKTCKRSVKIQENEKESKKKKVLLINGSPDRKGCISTALKEAAKILNAEGIETEEIVIGNQVIRGCIGCRSCAKTGKCVFNDIVNETAPKLAEADGMIVGTPVYYGNPNGTVLSFLQRLFFSCGLDLHMKVGASVVSCRRGGNSATFEAVNQFFGISGMPTVPSSYWNDVHGFTGEDVYKDEEGLQTVQNLARNMAFMIKAIRAGQEAYGKPDMKHDAWTHFVR